MIPSIKTFINDLVRSVLVIELVVVDFQQTEYNKPNARFQDWLKGWYT